MGVRAGRKGYFGLRAKGGGKSLIATHPEHFVFIYQIEACQEGGGQEGGHLEDVEGS